MDPIYLMSPDIVAIDIELYNNKLNFDTELKFRGAVKKDLCLWLNRGLDIHSLKIDGGAVLANGISRDPDLGIADLRKIAISLNKSADRVEVSYSGILEPTMMPSWGCHGELCVGRGEVLWYPFSCSCKTILWGLLYGSHSRALLKFRVGGYTPIASIDLEEISGGAVIFRGENVYQPLEFVLGPFKRDLCSDRFELYMYTLRSPTYSCRELYRHLHRVLDAYTEIYSVEDPHRQHHIAFLEGSGGFHAGALTVLDSKQVSEPKALLLNLIHELSHIWWVGKIKLCSKSSTWLMEAIPEYITSRIAGSVLKIIDFEERAERVISRAREMLKQASYTPPTDIMIPMNALEDSIWRVVGQAIFYETGNAIGYETLDRVLSKHMTNAMKSEKPYCLTWETLKNDLLAIDPNLEKILKIYKAI